MPQTICRERPSARSPNKFVAEKENADALADLAIGNFIEMRDKTASKIFRAKKKLDHALEAALPRKYLPLYTEKHGLVQPKSIIFITGIAQQVASALAAELRPEEIAPKRVNARYIVETNA